MLLFKQKWPWNERSSHWPLHAPDGKDWPRLSIITPSFNQGRFIEETIRSVLQQGYPNLEYIVIDAGSTDGTVDIIKKYENQLAYWISESDRGQSDALNKALSRVTGDIVGWINSDDMYTKNCFSAVIKTFQHDSEALVVHGDRILIDEESHVMGWTFLPAFDPESTGYIVCSETAFWRRSPVTSARFNADLQFAMDLEFFCRLSAKGKFVKVDRFLGCFRCYPGNKSSTLQEVCLMETKREWESIYGLGHQGWKNKPQAGRIRHAGRLLTNPLELALPYLYRRLVLHRRGLHQQEETHNDGCGQGSRRNQSSRGSSGTPS